MHTVTMSKPVYTMFSEALNAFYWRELNRIDEIKSDIIGYCTIGQWQKVKDQCDIIVKEYIKLEALNHLVRSSDCQWDKSIESEFDESEYLFENKDKYNILVALGSYLDNISPESLDETKFKTFAQLMIAYGMIAEQ